MEKNTYDDDVAVIVKFRGQSNMALSSLGHLEDNIRQLRRLTDCPIQQHNAFVRIDLPGVDHDVLQADVEVHSAAIVRVLCEDDMVESKVARCLDDWRVCWVTYQDGA